MIAEKYTLSLFYIIDVKRMNQRYPCINQELSTLLMSEMQ